MRKTFLFLGVFVHIILISCAQNNKDKESATIQHYIRIGNSRVSFPKTSFKPKDNFIGLIKNDNAMIQVMESTDDSFQNQAKNFKESEFTSKGGKILQNKDIHVDGFQAKYLTVESLNRKLSLLLLGDETFVVMLSAVNNNIYDEKTNEEIEYILKNVKYDKNIKLDPLKSAPFTILKNNTHFKHAKFANNLHFYTKSGKFIEGKENEPFVIIGSNPLESENEFEEMLDFSIQMVEKYGGKINTKIKKEKTEINGYQAYENLLEVNKNGETEKLYLLLLYSNKMILQIQGKFSDDKNLPYIKEFAHNVRFRK